MIYLRSKAQIAKYLIPIFQNIIDKNNISTYIEPFVGGANIIDKIKCDNRIGYDLSRTLIALLCAARDDCDKIPIMAIRNGSIKQNLSIEEKVMKVWKIT